MADRGTNAGVTGLFNSPGQANAKFFYEGVAFALSHAVAGKQRIGRGTGIYPQVRAIIAVGSLTLSGILKGVGFPEPTAFRGQAGTVTIKVDTGRTITVPVTVTAAAYTTSKKIQDQIDVQFDCSITGAPTYAGFGGSQATATDVAYADLELYAGKSTTIDPEGLQSGATMNFDFIGVDATDAAEVTKINALIAATTPPFTGGKWRVGALTDRDPFGGTISLTAAYTTTAEDVVNTGTVTTTDASGLQTSGQVTTINNATPTAPAGQVVRTVAAQELNDSNIKYTAATGVETTAEERAREQESEVTDGNALNDAYYVCQQDNATPPAAASGYKLVDTKHIELPAKTHNVTGVKDEYVFKFARRDSKDDVEMDGSSLDVDLSGLDSKAVVVKLQNNATPAWPSSPFTNSVQHSYRPKQLNDGKWAVAYVFEYETNAQRIVREAQSEHLGDWKARAVTAAMDGAAPAHGTLAEVAQEVVNLPNGHVVNKKVHGLETDPQQWAREGTFTATDPDGLESHGQVAKVGSEGTAPAGQVIIETKTQGLPDGTTGYVSKTGLATSEQSRELAGTVIADDQQDMVDQETYTLMGTLLSPPAVPTPATAALVHSITRRKEIVPGKWEFEYIFKRVGTHDAAEYEGLHVSSDPSTLKSSKKQRILSANATESAPAAPSGMKVVGYDTRRDGQSGQYIHDFTYGYRDNKEEIEAEGSEVKEDVSLLGGYSTITIIAATVPATPATPSPGQKIVAATKKNTSNPGLFAWTFHYAVNDSEDEIEFGATHALYTNSAEGTSESAAVVAISTSVDATANAYFNAHKDEATFAGCRGKQLTSTKMLLTDIRQSDNIWTRSNRQGDWIMSPVRLNAGVPEVYVSDVIHSHGDWYEIRLKAQRMFMVGGILTVRRSVSAASANPNNYSSYYATANTGTFLGCAAGTLAFDGVEYEANISVATPRRDMVTYRFKQNSLGWIDTGDALDEWMRVEIAGTAPTAGWATAASLGISGVAAFTGQDYSGLIA